MSEAKDLLAPLAEWMPESRTVDIHCPKCGVSGVSLTIKPHRDTAVLCPRCRGES